MKGQISIKTKFGWISAFEKNGKIIKVKFGKTKNGQISKNLKNFRSYLNSFSKGKSKFKKISFLIQGDSNQKKVWRELRKIRFGRTKSYGEIGKKYNLSPRHIGKICGQNKLLLIIPCHRVIKTDGSIGGFSSTGGVNLKKKLLIFEKTNSVYS